MPISPPTELRYDLIETVMQKIDSDIKTTAQQEGTCESYRVIVTDNLTLEERAYIHQEYLDCDWSHVTSRTSAENGERPGLLMFTLTT